MKTQNQIMLIKLGYILTLITVVLFSLTDMARGSEDGYADGGNGGVFGLVHGTLILIISFFCLRVLLYLYRFIDSVQVGNVFSEENTSRLKRMGWYCTAIPFLLFIFNAMDYVRASGNDENLTLKIIQNVDFQFWLLIFGLTLLTIAFVFKKGIELKQEHDLTV